MWYLHMEFSAEVGRAVQRRFGPQVRATLVCARTACLDEAKCNGYRPRTGRGRFERVYNTLGLSHGVVSHKAEEWSLVKEVTVFSSTGRPHTIKLKHGTQCADGAWSEVKSAIPSSLNSSDHQRIAEYVGAWAWRARRHGEDTFNALARPP